MPLRFRTIAGVAGVAASAALIAGFAGGAGRAASTAAPQNTNPPTIGGTAQAGSKLTASPGSWSGTTPISYAYQWLRCDKGGNNCLTLREKSSTYYLGQHDVGFTLRVRVTATNSQGSGTATSSQTSAVTSNAASAPANTAVPVITGTPKQGESLTVTNGSWTGTEPIKYDIRWQRCDTTGARCVDLRERSRTYRLGPNDVGRTLRAVVTATNKAGNASAVTAPTAVISTATTPPSTPGQCQSISSVSPPSRLLVDRIEFQPSRIASRETPLVARFHVVASNGGCVNGALVYAIGVPFDRLTRAPEVQTDATGWTTITFQVLPTFQLRHNNLVVIFVRARKAGESLLGGVSTRRLVSIRVA